MVAIADATADVGRSFVGGLRRGAEFQTEASSDLAAYGSELKRMSIAGKFSHLVGVAFGEIANFATAGYIENRSFRKLTHGGDVDFGYDSKDLLIDVADDAIDELNGVSSYDAEVEGDSDRAYSNDGSDVVGEDRQRSSDLEESVGSSRTRVARDGVDSDGESDYVEVSIDDEGNIHEAGDAYVGVEKVRSYLASRKLAGGKLENKKMDGGSLEGKKLENKKMGEKSLGGKRLENEEMGGGSLEDSVDDVDWDKVESEIERARVGLETGKGDTYGAINNAIDAIENYEAKTGNIIGGEMLSTLGDIVENYDGENGLVLDEGEKKSETKRGIGKRGKLEGSVGISGTSVDTGDSKEYHAITDPRVNHELLTEIREVVEKHGVSEWDAYHIIENTRSRDEIQKKRENKRGGRVPGGVEKNNEGIGTKEKVRDSRYSLDKAWEEASIMIGRKNDKEGRQYDKDWDAAAGENKWFNGKGKSGVLDNRYGPDKAWEEASAIMGRKKEKEGQQYDKNWDDAHAENKWFNGVQRKKERVVNAEKHRMDKLEAKRIDKSVAEIEAFDVEETKKRPFYANVPFNVLSDSIGEIKSSIDKHEKGLDRNLRWIANNDFDNTANRLEKGFLDNFGVAYVPSGLNTERSGRKRALTMEEKGDLLDKVEDMHGSSNGPAFSAPAPGKGKNKGPV